MPVGWAAAAAGIASIAGSVITANAAGQAADQLSAGFNTAQQDIQPWLTGGGNALAELQRSLGLTPGGSNYKASPGYQWELGQGLSAVQNSAAAKGGVSSGNTLKALQSYGTGLANQDFQQYLNNLMGLSSQGLGAGQAIGQDAVGAAAAQAGGTIGQANEISKGIGSLGSIGAQYAYQNMFANNQSNPYASTGGQSYYDPW